MTTQEKDRARSQAQAAIPVAGKKCEGCGTPGKLHRHHEDYAKPLDVRILCPKCHGGRHKEINQERIRLSVDPESPRIVAMKPKCMTYGQWYGFCWEVSKGVSMEVLIHSYGRKPATIYNWLKKLGRKPEAGGTGSKEEGNEEEKG